MHLCHCVDVSILHVWMCKCVGLFAYMVIVLLVCKVVWFRLCCLFGPPGWFVQLVNSSSWLVHPACWLHLVGLLLCGVTVLVQSCARVHMRMFVTTCVCLWDDVGEWANIRIYKWMCGCVNVFVLTNVIV